MRRDSIQKYLRIFIIVTTVVCIVATHAHSQFYVSKSCINNTATGSTSATPNCYPATTFFDTDLSSTARNWNFGDPNATLSNVDTSRNAHHQYSKAGSYVVSLTKTIGGVVQPYIQQTIVVGTPPAQPLFNKKKKSDSTVCSGPIKLDPYKGTSTPSNVTYLWFPRGETTPTIDVDSSGCYSVEVFSADGCSSIAQITMKFCLQQANKPSKKDVWYFGDKGALQFIKVPGTPLPVDPLSNKGTIFSTPAVPNGGFSTAVPTNGNVLTSPQAMAMVFGTEGNVVFYSNGKSILNGDNEPVPAVPPLTNELSGDPTTTQSVVIVPKAACNQCPYHQYYVFVQDAITKMLTYSVVDMRTKDKKGIIVEKNVPIYYPVSERMTGVIANDSAGFYVISHSAAGKNFIISKIDSTGMTVKTQNMGLSTDTPESNQGYLRVSPKGDKVAIAISDGTKNYIEVYNFDNTKGTLSATPLTITLPDAPPRVYGVEFSPDEQKLYVTLKGTPNDGTQPATRADSSFLYQLNLNLGNSVAISKAAIKIDSSGTVAFGALQMDSNNQAIYMAIPDAKNDNGQSVMYSIPAPNALETRSTHGSQIGYLRGPYSGTQIAGSSILGLPNVVKAKPNSSDDGPSATFENTCQNSTTIFEATPICNPMTNKYLWDFGDGTTKETSDKTITHKYTNPGKYNVSLTLKTYTTVAKTSSLGIPLVGDITSFCKDTVLTDVINIRPQPQINLPDTLYVCVLEGESKTLDPQATGGTNFVYHWMYNTKDIGSSIAQTPTLSVSAIGKYYVNVQNQENCYADAFSHVLNGCEPQVLIPTAFTPNGDTKNDKLQVITKYVTDFELHIFNRWGEEVFYTDKSTMPPDTTNYWDGRYNNVIYAPMNYAYVLQYKSQDFPKRPMIVVRGGILVAQ